MTPPRVTTMNQMYINPAIISVCVAIFMALLAIGGILWKGAGLLGDLRRDVAVINERLDGPTKRGMCNFNNRGAYESVIPATQNDDAIRNLRSGEIVSDLPYFLRLNARC